MKTTRVHVRLHCISEGISEDASLGLDLPTGLVIERARLAGLPIERLTPVNCEARVVLHVPGGAPDSHRALAARLATSCRAKVVMPEHSVTASCPFLSGIDDLVAIYRALVRRGTPAEQIVVVGVAGGGGLAVAMLLHARELGLPMPRALILLSPCMANHPPSELAGLPATLIQVGDRELSVTGQLFEGFRAAGIELELEAYANLRHGCAPFEAMPDAIEAIDRIATFVDDRFAPRFAGGLRAVG